MSRGKQIYVRMDPADYELVQAEAARTGKSDAAVLRDAFLGREIEGGDGFEVYRRQRSGRSAQAPARREDPMAEVFLCETGQLTEESRQALREAGIVVVEVTDPSRCQFIRSGEAVSGDDLLWAAVEALRHREYGHGGKGDWQRSRFADNIASVIMAEHERQWRQRFPAPKPQVGTSEASGV